MSADAIDLRNAGMWPFRRLLSIPVLIPMSAALAAAALFGNSSGPQPGLTGGFNDGTCTRCHTAYGLNDGRVRGGIFQIDGVPRNYEPGRAYHVRVVIGHPGQSRWGFQLSSRFAASGHQAGEWVAEDGNVQVKADGEILYAMHTPAGSRKGEKDGPVDFRMKWGAPAAKEGMVLFNAAGNAADSRDTPEGDFIYTAGSFSTPSEAVPQEVEPVEVTATPASQLRRAQEDSRIGSLPAPVDLKRGTIEIQIQHRFFESLADSSPGDAFGIDSGANINLGVNYGITNRLSAGIARSRVDQVIEMRGAFELLTAKDLPWKLSLQGGVEGRRNFREHYSPFVQLAASVDRGPVRLNFVPTLVFNSRPDAQLEFARDRAINPDSNHTFALGLGTDIAVNRRISLLGEYVPRLAGFGGFDERRDHVAAGVAVRTWGHVFTILVARSRDFTPAKYAVNSEADGVALGFNIYRRIR